jgi:hypothetical protein
MTGGSWCQVADGEGAKGGGSDKAKGGDEGRSSRSSRSDLSSDLCNGHNKHGEAVKEEQGGAEGLSKRTRTAGGAGMVGVQVVPEEERKGGDAGRDKDKKKNKSQQTTKVEPSHPSVSAEAEADAAVEQGGAGGKVLTLGQLGQVGMHHKIDVAITEPRKTAEEERACRLEGQRLLHTLRFNMAAAAAMQSPPPSGAGREEEQARLYAKMQPQRQRLPAYEMRDTILAAVRRHQAPALPKP